MKCTFSAAKHNTIQKFSAPVQEFKGIIIREFAFAGNNIGVVTVQAPHITACKPKYAGCFIRVIQ